MRTVLFGLFAAVNDFLHRPWVVFWTCFALAFVNVVMDGTILRIWGLNRDVQQLASSSSEIKKELVVLNDRIKLAADPTYMESEARDRFDLVSEGDLVFVFTDED